MPKEVLLCRLKKTFNKTLNDCVHSPMRIENAAIVVRERQRKNDLLPESCIFNRIPSFFVGYCGNIPACSQRSQKFPAHKC